MNGEKIIAIQGQAGDWEQAIRLCGQALCQAGVVGGEFAQECVRREQEYPTGICTDVPVAIPHCKSEAILESGVCYLRLEQPVEFRRMDDDEETVMTRSIFNLAIKSAGSHLDFLQQMMSVVGDEELVAQLERMDIEQVPALLEERLHAAEE